MDYDKLIEQLRDKGCEDCPHRNTCKDDDMAECVIRLNAATIIEVMWAENEKLRAELESKEKYYEQMIDALSATDSADLARVTAERDAALTALNALSLASGWQCYECDNVDAPDGNSRCNGCNYIEGNNYKWRGIKED